MSKKMILRAALAAIALAAAAPTVLAESAFVTGAGSAPLTATARLDFRIVVPNVLYLRVGTGTDVANNATINELLYNVPAAALGNGASVFATGGDRDLVNPGSSVTARVFSNNGSVELTAGTTGPLQNAAGDTISWGQFSISSLLLTANPAGPLSHPTLVDGGNASITVPATGRVVNRDAVWTFGYANSAQVPQGEYIGRVTYTAAQI